MKWFPLLDKDDSSLFLFKRIILIFRGKIVISASEYNTEDKDLYLGC